MLNVYFSALPVYIVLIILCLCFTDECKYTKTLYNKVFLLKLF